MQKLNSMTVEYVPQITTTKLKKVGDEWVPDEPPELDEMAAPMHPPIRADRLGVRRNGQCPCGSGRKFKKCCRNPKAQTGAAV